MCMHEGPSLETSIFPLSFQVVREPLGADHLTFDWGGGGVISCRKDIFLWSPYVQEIFFLSLHYARYFFLPVRFRVQHFFPIA